MFVGSAFCDLRLGQPVRRTCQRAIHAGQRAAGEQHGEAAGGQPDLVDSAHDLLLYRSPVGVGRRCDSSSRQNGGVSLATTQVSAGATVIALLRP
jgi:hypothetical protein